MAALTTLGAALALGFGAPAVPQGVGDLFVSTQLCWAASGVEATGFDACAFTGDPATTNSIVDQITPNPDGVSPDQVFRGRASASATRDTWRVSSSLDLTDYRRDSYRWTPDPVSGGFGAATTAVASASTSDSLTVSGGAGVFSLKYILSVEGLLSTNSSLLSSTFCVGLVLPQGAQVVSGFCASAGDAVPGIVELSYSGLEFDVALTPRLSISAIQFVQPLFPDEVPELGAQTFSASGAVDFGSTVRLTSMLVTDADGNPIPGLSISSASGFAYPLDPANAVPEPATALLLLGGLAWLGTVASRRAARPGR